MYRPVHFEIQADDPQRAIKFYTQLFGWNIKSIDMGDSKYWLITTGPDNTPGINGGLYKRQKPASPGSANAYICTIEVPNLDEFLAKVKSAGGLVDISPNNIPGVGKWAQFKDTEGNLFGLLQPSPEFTP